MTYGKARRYKYETRQGLRPGGSLWWAPPTSCWVPGGVRHTSGVRHGFVAVTTAGEQHCSLAWLLELGSWNPRRVVTGFSAACKISLREVQPAGSNHLQEHAGITVFGIGGSTVSQRFCWFLTFAKRRYRKLGLAISTTSTHWWGSCFRHPSGRSD